MKLKPKYCIGSFFIFATLSSCSDLKNPSLETLYKDYLAGQDVKHEKYDEALSKYYTLLENDPNRFSTHSNIGVLLSHVQKPEEALKSLQYALKLAEEQGDREQIFKVRYNLGVYYGALKKIPEALENYQAALDLVPTSHEIKTNIELLMQQQKQDQKQKKGEGEQKEKDQSQNDQKNNENKNDQGENQQPQKPQSSPKYQPRPFKGEQLSEGDVKKILGELRNQEQKIRANFDKKEKKGKSSKNEKDW